MRLNLLPLALVVCLSTFLTMPVFAAGAKPQAAPAKTPAAKTSTVGAEAVGNAPDLVIPGAAPASNEVQPESVVAENQVVLPADGPYLVRINNVRGRIIFKRWNKNVVWVQATVRATRPISGNQLTYFKAAVLQKTTPRPDEAEFATIWRGVRENYPAVVAAKAPHVEVDYVVALPPETAIVARQEVGPIIAADLDGRIDLYSRDGDVSVTGCKGWIEAANQRGKVTVADVAGDVVARSFHGAVTVRAAQGDVRALTSTGSVRVDVSPRWVGEVSYHTVSGAFRSDLATFDTQLENGDTGYIGVMRGPLAEVQAAPAVRIRIDTTSGDVTLTSDQHAKN